MEVLNRLEALSERFVYSSMVVTRSGGLDWQVWRCCRRVPVPWQMCPVCGCIVDKEVYWLNGTDD